jgi:hypothetical protein
MLVLLAEKESEGDLKRMNFLFEPEMMRFGWGEIVKTLKQQQAELAVELLDRVSSAASIAFSARAFALELGNVIFFHFLWGDRWRPR